MAKIKKAQSGKEVGDYFWKDPKYKFSTAKKPMTSVVKSNDGNYRKKTTYLGDDNVDKRLIKERRTVKGLLTGAPKAGGKMETIEPMKKGGKVTKAKDGKWMQKVSKSIKARGTEGKCTPITKPGCTGRAKALAKTFKKIAKARKSK